MKSELREQAIKFRIKNELSYGEISKRLNVSKSTLSYWLGDIPLSEKRMKELRKNAWQKGEASREKFRLTMREKRKKNYDQVYEGQKKKLKNLKAQSFFVAGLMLYLGEGDKKNRSRIGLSNTDPKLILFFKEWLRQFLEVSPMDMRAELHLYENMDIAKEEKFWQDTLSFPRSQFYKVQVRKLREGSFSYSESFRHGTCSFYVNGAKKKEEIMAAINAFVDMYLVRDIVK